MSFAKSTWSGIEHQRTVGRCMKNLRAIVANQHAEHNAARILAANINLEVWLTMLLMFSGSIGISASDNVCL